MLYTEGLWVPLVVIDGVHILPGIPRLFQQMLSAAEDTLPRGAAVHRCELGSNEGEGDIADPLRSIAQDFPQVLPTLTFPTGTHLLVHTHFTIRESCDANAVLLRRSTSVATLRTRVIHDAKCSCDLKAEILLLLRRPLLLREKNCRRSICDDRNCRVCLIIHWSNDTL